MLSSVLAYLKRHPRVAWAHRFNSGAGKIARNGGVSQFMRWGFPGCPDVLGQLTDGRTLAVECKRPSIKDASPEQQEFLALVERNGGVAVLARSIDDVEAALS